jgi:hypothetical protein
METLIGRMKVADGYLHLIKREDGTTYIEVVQTVPAPEGDLI